MTTTRTCHDNDDDNNATTTTTATTTTRTTTTLTTTTTATMTTTTTTTTTKTTTITKRSSRELRVKFLKVSGLLSAGVKRRYQDLVDSGLVDAKMADDLMSCFSDVVTRRPRS